MTNKQNLEVLQLIARHLMLHSSFMENIGLLEGKMGVALFFYHYSVYTKKKLYNDFGGELIDDIYNEIHLNYPLDFKSGLSGIAWGIDYLIRNNFIDADPDDALEELDQKILERDVRRITDISLETGLTGLAYYTIGRFSNRNKNRHNIPYEYVVELIASLESKLSKKDQEYHIIEDLKKIISGELVLKTINPLYQFYKESNYNINFTSEADNSLGIINNGLTGIGLNLMGII